MAETITEIPVIKAFPSSGSAAKFTLLNNRPCIKYDTNNQEVLFQGILPDKYLGGSLRVKLFSVLNPYIAGSMVWEVSFKKLAAGVDYLGAGYNSTKTLLTTPSGLNILNIDYVTFTNTDLGYDINALDELFILKVKVNSLQSGSAVNLLNVMLENV